MESFSISAYHVTLMLLSILEKIEKSKVNFRSTSLISIKNEVIELQNEYYSNVSALKAVKKRKEGFIGLTKILYKLDQIKEVRSNHFSICENCSCRNLDDENLDKSIDLFLAAINVGIVA